MHNYEDYLNHEPSKMSIKNVQNSCLYSNTRTFSVNFISQIHSAFKPVIKTSEISWKIFIKTRVINLYAIYQSVTVFIIYSYIKDDEKASLRKLYIPNLVHQSFKIAFRHSSNHPTFSLDWIYSFDGTHRSAQRRISKLPVSLLRPTRTIDHSRTFFKRLKVWKSQEDRLKV